MTSASGRTYALKLFQLTHPWGCDYLCRWLFHIVGISTHTPVRVWHDLYPIFPCAFISTHTPVRVWRQAVRDEINDLEISTHTPVRVWPTGGYAMTNSWGFQLTHPWGCDLRWLCGIKGYWISTHTPVRVWLPQACKPICTWNFNSHTREGVTYPNLLNLLTNGFQLTHPWGCDKSIRNRYSIFVISTHTPVRVWLHSLRIRGRFLQISTHTPVRVWQMWSYLWRVGNKFQLTHPWGCDR